MLPHRSVLSLSIFLASAAFSSEQGDQQQAHERYCPPEPESMVFVPLNEIMAGQRSVSMEVVDKISKEIKETVLKGESLKEQKKTGRIRGFFLENGKPVFCFNHKTSPLMKPLRVIQTMGIGGLRPYILSDSHHTLERSPPNSLIAFT